MFIGLVYSLIRIVSSIIRRNLTSRLSNLPKSKMTTIYGRSCSNTQKLDHASFHHIVYQLIVLTISLLPLYIIAFIRVLLENVGVEINPIRLIRRIRDGLEIPGLRAAVIKILQDFNLQISLLEGCQTILDSDIMDTMDGLQSGQMKGFMGAGTCLFFFGPP